MRAKQFITEGYKEIEFVCVNSRFSDASPVDAQAHMYYELKKIPGVIPLWQDWSTDDEQQLSLAAIYKDPKTKQAILAAAKQHGLEVDLIQPVTDEYVDRAIRGEHEGQLQEEIIDEYERDTPNSKQIFDKLEGLGYKKLGHGADATVWAKDENHVIKILMPSRYVTYVTNAERGFMTFYNFCKKHPELPNLPHFIDIGGQGHAVFEINGTPYRQIAMERLQPIPNDSFEEAMVWMLADLAKYRSSWPSIVKQLGKPESWAGYPGTENISNEVVKRFVDPVVNKQYGILYLTMSRLYHSGLKSGLGWDLHTENAMLRPDGTIVIVDPYFT